MLYHGESQQSIIHEICHTFSSPKKILRNNHIAFPVYSSYLSVYVFAALPSYHYKDLPQVVFEGPHSPSVGIRQDNSQYVVGYSGGSVSSLWLLLVIVLGAALYCSCSLLFLVLLLLLFVIVVATSMLDDVVAAGCWMLDARCCCSCCSLLFVDVPAAAR
jgi:hypothetical protein